MPMPKIAEKCFQDVSLMMFPPHFPGFQLFYRFCWLLCPIQNVGHVSVPGPEVSFFVLIGQKNWPFEKGKLECNISIIVYINRRCYLLMNKKNISMRTLPSAHIFAGYSRECCCKSRSATSPVAARSLSLRQAQNFRTRKPIPTF